jgi:hypothetical protein
MLFMRAPDADTTLAACPNANKQAILGGINNLMQEGNFFRRQSFRVVKF